MSDLTHTPAAHVSAAAKSVAEIATPTPAKYMSQLCKHFAHKVPVTLDEDSGQIRFTFGDCDLKAQAETLTLTCIAPNADDLPQLQDVVARHLVRFAFREPDMQIDWRPA
jgi:hypothetical protein